jgi:hypothetical protein
MNAAMTPYPLFIAAKKRSKPTNDAKSQIPPNLNSAISLLATSAGK